MAGALVDGQYQIGDVIFGRGTIYPVSVFDRSGYQINDQDFQVTNTDEMRFGIDSFGPGPIAITMGVIDNFMLPNMSGLTHVPPAQLLRSSPALERLQKEWRGDDIRSLWNAQKPLLCHRNGILHRIYGRPRKFTYSWNSMKAQWIDVVCDYQPSDSLSYTNDEFGQIVSPSGAGTTTATIARTGGEGDSWIRFLITGPITNPVIKFGSQTIGINTVLGAGKLIEISSYPWDRRIVNSDGLNLSASLVATSPYLDEIIFQARSSKGVGLSGSSTTGSTQMFVLWRDAYLAL